MTVRVVGLGQRAAGDDGAGLAVLDALEARGLDGATLIRAREASVLVEMMAEGEPLIVVDAALVPEEHIGTARERALHELDATPNSGVSSHGIGVAQAIELGKALHPGWRDDLLHLVSVGIARPTHYGTNMDPRVGAGVHDAATIIERIVRDQHA